jgi:hypothetical protein
MVVSLKCIQKCRSDPYVAVKENITFDRNCPI